MNQNDKQSGQGASNNYGEIVIALTVAFGVATLSVNKLNDYLADRKALKNPVSVSGVALTGDEIKALKTDQKDSGVAAVGFGVGSLAVFGLAGMAFLAGRKEQEEDQKPASQDLDML